MASKGDIRQIVSDPGTQLQGAAKELSEWRKKWDPEQLARFGAEKGLEWKFIMAASQHQNGGAESLVKGIIKSLMHAIGETKLSLNEFNTLLAECANLANERPIRLKTLLCLVEALQESVRDPSTAVMLSVMILSMLRRGST